ncbi:hypothetical protein BUALT_Bualt04G0141500 [Buddleja alternifolia]|uniref:Mitochondrial glycoprotein n=1 Tax=Buddleja alternifolia TaxID=168488 RepID=A0AAV6XW88_9LAMI|nr:hypothetical protein BUALT_Bualt04G0141500 [Buddleja alternifolia]
MIGGALINGCRRSLLSPFNHNSIIKSISSTVSSSSRRRMAHYTSTAVNAPQTTKKPSSPIESNMIRILRNEIKYQIDYAPPHEPVTEFDRFSVEDRPGEQWITLRGKSGDDESIKIEATMFDGSVIAPEAGEDNLQLHISVLVDIWKGEGSDSMEFVCSAWPDSLEIQKVYVFRREESPVQPYMGPDIKNLNTKLRSGFYEFLKTRGVDDGLSEFLHEYMMNKDRIELIKWLRKVQSCIGK